MQTWVSSFEGYITRNSVGIFEVPSKRLCSLYCLRLCQHLYCSCLCDGSSLLFKWQDPGDVEVSSFSHSHLPSVYLVRWAFWSSGDFCWGRFLVWFSLRSFVGGCLFSVFVLFVLLRWNWTLSPRLALDSGQSTCLSLTSGRIIATSYYAQLFCDYLIGVFSYFGSENFKGIVMF